jgi:hypothetical protein
MLYMIYNIVRELNWTMHFHSKISGSKPSLGARRQGLCVRRRERQIPNLALVVGARRREIVVARTHVWVRPGLTSGGCAKRSRIGVGRAYHAGSCICYLPVNYKFLSVIICNSDFKTVLSNKICHLPVNYKILSVIFCNSDFKVFTCDKNCYLPLNYKFFYLRIYMLLFENIWVTIWEYISYYL